MPENEAEAWDGYGEGQLLQHWGYAETRSKTKQKLLRKMQNVILCNRLKAANLDFWLPVVTDSIQSSTIGMPVLENMGVAVGISLLSCLKAEIWVTSGLVAAILDFWLPVTSDSSRSNVIGFPVPENMGTAVGILFLSSPQAEIWVFTNQSRYLRFPTSGFIWHCSW